jgi:fucose 4-O-acetylase-like acetyltransferase
MPELLWGLLVGALLSLAGWLMVRPALGRDPLQVMARLVGAFLLKLLLVTVIIIALSRTLEQGPLVRFSLALLAVLLPLGLVQALACVRILKRKTGTDS